MNAPTAITRSVFKESDLKGGGMVRSSTNIGSQIAEATNLNQYFNMNADA